MDLDRYLSDPTALIADHFVLETGQTYGACIQKWQRSFFEAVFATRPDGLPAYRLLYDERRRGESKTEDMAAAAVADLLTGPPRHRSYAVAGDAEQAALILDSIQGFKARSAVLGGLQVGRALVLNPATDSQLIVMSSDDRTAFGVRPRKVYFDELSLQVDDRLWVAFWSAIGKRPTAQMVAVSMAGYDFSSIGWQVREQAAKSERYYFHSREGSELAPWLRAEDMAEQERTLHPADYSRFWLCKWTEAAGTWITREMYDAAEVGAEPRGGEQHFSYYGAVDVGLVHDATAVAVCHLDGDRVVLDHLATLQGSRSNPVELGAVEELVLELSQRFQVSKWIFESPQAVGSVQRLQQRLGVQRVVSRWPTVETQAKLFGNLYQLFANHRLVLFPHEQLRREALNLVTRVVGGRMKVVDSSAVHQDHVIALGIAAELATGKKRSLILAPPAGMTSRSTWLGEGVEEVDRGSLASAAAPSQSAAIPDGTICGYVNRDGVACTSERFHEDGRCIRCDHRRWSGINAGRGTPMPVLMLKAR
ncbi:MAG: hypothetical protein ACYDB4_19385 [Candidatus Dormibacteraceae bacterium]